MRQQDIRFLLSRGHLLMHILQLVPSLRVGGVERGGLDAANGLVQRGHRALAAGNDASNGWMLEAPGQRPGRHRYAIRQFGLLSFCQIR